MAPTPDPGASGAGEDEDGGTFAWDQEGRSQSQASDGGREAIVGHKPGGHLGHCAYCRT